MFLSHNWFEILKIMITDALIKVTQRIGLVLVKYSYIVFNDERNDKLEFVLPKLVEKLKKNLFK